VIYWTILSVYLRKINLKFLFRWKIFSLFSRLTLEIPFFIDIYRSLFLASVRVIALAVTLFSKSYIINEKYFLRFHLLLMSFVASIFLLILRPNLIRILLGWDGLGVTSYLLVIYFQRTKSYNAGIITALRNRVGDVLILIRIRLRVSIGSWNFMIYFFDLNNYFFLMFILLLGIAACTKRAQIPFSAWLPAAIAAPTPVSSLVHSSTLVTAGVYLLIRFYSIIEISEVRVYILWIGTLTIVIAGLSALFEIDIKKIVALSTLSQLGLIIRAIGLGKYEIAFFHILTHAYFKALLFITVGNIIHLRRDYQDLRKTGLLLSLMPPTLRFCLIRNVRLCGAPFMAGFYSKDLWLEIANIRHASTCIILLFYIATALTAAYTARFIILTIFSPLKVKTIWNKDWDQIIISAIRVLWPLAIIGGRILRWILFSTPRRIFLPLIVKNFTIVIIFLGVSGGILKFQLLKENKKNLFFRWRLGSIWTLPFITTPVLNSFALSISYTARGMVDTIWNPFLIFTRVSSVTLQSLQEPSKQKRDNFFLYLIGFMIFLLLIFIYLHILNLFKSWKFKIFYAYS